MVTLTAAVSEPKNPGGNMGIGACLKVAGVDIFTESKFVPLRWENSNNVAEYMAFESLLDFIQANDIRDTKIHICGDSKLVIEQMNGRWRIKFGRYTPWADRCKAKLKALIANNKLSFTLQWIPRGQNSYADKLSKAQLIKNNVEFRIQPLEDGDKVEAVHKCGTYNSILPSYSGINDIR